MLADKYKYTYWCNKNFRIIILIPLFVFLANCVNLSPAKAQNFFSFDRKVKRLPIPFNFHRNLIIVPVYINDKGPYNFILDTGVSLGLIINPNLLNEFAFEKGTPVQIRGAGNSVDELKAFIIPHLNVKVPGITAPNLTLTCLSEDIFNLSSYVGMQIDGILGYQFFNSFVVQIDYNKSILTLHRPETFTYKRRHGTPIPFELEDKKPYLNVSTTLSNNQQIEAKVILDTGAGHALSLEKDSHSAIQVPSQAIRALLGTGLNGSINGYIGRVKNITLGKYTLPHVVSSFPDHADVGAKASITRNGNLGNELLKRFHVIIDYSRSKISLKPNQYIKEPFEHDMCGLEVIAVGQDYRRFIISTVAVGSPAAEADIQPGDEIMFLNGLAGEALDLTKIYKFYRFEDGYRLLFALKRDGNSIFRFVTLKRKI